MKLREWGYSGVKRAGDLVMATAGLVLLLPFAAIIKIIFVAHGDLNSIFFAQTRLGKNGKEFRLYKFRTMTQNAEKELEKMLKKDVKIKREYEKYRKFEQDPRVLPFARWLRLTSLDEWPQFLNVLKGEMSVVGPRPMLEGEINQKDKKLYQSVRPGMTGYWAVMARNEVDIDDRIELEKYYIKHRSLKLDLMILVKTVGAVIKRTGK